jgi:hypothetical protein
VTPAEIAAALGGRRDGNGWRCRCPAHDDHNPSLDIVERDDKPLLICRAGCDQAVVVDALQKRGLWGAKPNDADRAAKSGRIVATYDYRDEAGALLFQVCRRADKDGFPQRRPDGAGGWIWGLGDVRRVLFRLPELIATPLDQTVYIVEGEKDATNLNKAFGVPTTCNIGGTGMGWRAEYNRDFAGRNVVILPDNDDSGRAHAANVVRNLAPLAAQIRVLHLQGLPPSGDISDWLDAGGSQSDLETLVELTEPYGAEGVTKNDHDIGARLANAAELVARHFTEPKWAVPQIVAEGLTILAGRPKTGKSWLALDFAVAVAGGHPAMGNLPCQQGDVLLLALEDNDRRLHQRLKAVLQSRPAPAALEYATQWRRADAGGLDDLHKWLTTHPGARLVVIDTLQMVRGQRRRDDGVYADDYLAVGQLKALADEFNVPVLVVHHLRKEAASDPLESVSGTSGLTGSADTTLVLKREPKESLGRLYARGRDVPEAEIAMQFDEATGKWLRLIGVDDFRLSKERRAIIRTLHDIGEPMTPAEIAAAIGKSQNSTRFLLHKMRGAGDVVRCDDGRYATSH